MPRNLKLIIEEQIGEKGLSGEPLSKVLKALVGGAKPKEIAAILSSDGKEEMVINAAANSAFKDKATATMRLGLRLAITIFPVLLIFISYWLINKKYIINEEYYENMVNEIREKLKKSDDVEIIV